MKSIIIIEVDRDDLEVQALEADLVDWLTIEKHLTIPLEATVRSGPLGDPLPRRSRESSNEPSEKQWKLFNWKMGILADLITEAKNNSEFDPVVLNFAADVQYIASVERRDGTIDKSRIHQLIDAVLDAIADMEFELAR